VQGVRACAGRELSAAGTTGEDGETQVSRGCFTRARRYDEWLVRINRVQRRGRDLRVAQATGSARRKRCAYCGTRGAVWTTSGPRNASGRPLGGYIAMGIPPGLIALHRARRKSGALGDGGRRRCTMGGGHRCKRHDSGLRHHRGPRDRGVDMMGSGSELVGA